MHRRFIIWLDDAGGPLYGAVEWYRDGRRCEMAGTLHAGPFDTPDDVLRELLELEPLAEELELPLGL